MFFFVVKVCFFFGRIAHFSSLSITINKSIIIGQSHDFGRAYSLFVAQEASFAPEQGEGANVATRDTNKLYAR